jgi:phage terminase large subunit-like protein
LPSEGLSEKSRADHTPFDVWARQGHLRTRPGRTIDLDFVAHELRELLSTCNVQRVAYDPWNWDFFRPSLMRAGTESMINERFVAFPQTTKAMSPALGHLERLLLDRRVVHDNPCLTSCIVHTTMDPGGNRAPDKRRAMHRIDGTIGLLMTLATAPTAQNQAIDIAALIGWPAPRLPPVSQDRLLHRHDLRLFRRWLQVAFSQPLDQWTAVHRQDVEHENRFKRKHAAL